MFDFYFPFKMYVEPRLLEALGFEPSMGPLLIPLYTRKRMVPVQPHSSLIRAVDHDPDIQFLVSIILQVTDGSKFRR